MIIFMFFALTQKNQKIKACRKMTKDGLPDWKFLNSAFVVLRQ